LATMCCVPLVLILLVISPIFAFIQIVPEYQRAVTVQKKGGENSVIKVHNPGFLFVNLFTTKSFKVDIREKEKNTEVLAISRPDNSKIKIQTEWAYRIVDPIKSISLPGIELAVEGMVAVTLREIVENMSIDSIKTDQLQVEKKWHDRLVELIENKWGVKISHVEIQKITKMSLEVV
jgi:regulator of protease activity HflC (stomatin/prohibitin superfamily)